MLSCLYSLAGKIPNVPVQAAFGLQHGSTILSQILGKLGNVPEALALSDGKLPGAD